MNIQRIHEKINVIKEKDPQEKTFKFLPKATEEDLLKFENQFKIVLPSDYRLFLKTVANGIINVKSRISDIIEPVDLKDYYYQEHIYNPSLEFPLTKRVFWDEPSEADKKYYPYETDYSKFNWEQCSNGYISLLGTGCGCFYFIVVNGKEYGNIWCNNDASNSEILPEFCRKGNLERNRIDFDFWINGQLDLAIRSC